MSAGAPAAPAIGTDQLTSLLESRQNTLPRRLTAPGPTAGQLVALIDAAAQAPDHARMQPWRFVRVTDGARGALADAFEQALAERRPDSSPDAMAQARDKAHRSPALLLAVVDAGQGAQAAAIPLSERLLSCGCAVQNLLLMATAQGFGSSLTSGQSLQSQAVRALFGLRETEQAVCFINIGTVLEAKPARLRPTAEALVTTLHAQDAPNRSNALGRTSPAMLTPGLDTPPQAT